MLNVFIGFDRRSHVAYHVCHQSIFARASRPVAITPLVLPTLPVMRTGLTDFTFTRFLVPSLCNFKGKALFMDSDIIVQADIAELFDLADTDEEKAVWCVPYEGNLAFERAGVLLFNCAHKDNRKLTAEYIDTTQDSLHKLGWTKHIGDLPMEWGHLVMYQKPSGKQKLIHYTAGLPIFPETVHLGFSEEWQEEAKRMTSTQSWQDLMGNSVHAKYVMQALQQKQQREQAATDDLAKLALEQAQ